MYFIRNGVPTNVLVATGNNNSNFMEAFVFLNLNDEKTQE